MNNSETPRIRSLLRQADRNVASGKYAAAETLYRQILDEAPQSAAAWLGLAHVSRDQAEKRAAYKRVLAIDPGNSEAQVGLSDLHDTGADDAFAAGVDEQTSPAETGALENSVDEAQHSIDQGEKEPQSIGTNLNQAKTAEEHSHVTQYPREAQKQSVAYDPEIELFCYRHPDRSTSLRCYKCGKPICSECTVKTPVGYLCPACHREAEDAFYNNKATDYLLAALVALPLSLIAGWLVVRFSGGIFMILLFIFAGGAVGGFIARLAKRSIGNRRGRFIPHVVAACIIIGVLIFAWPWLFVLFAGAGGALLKLAGIGVYLFTAASSAFYWAR